MLDLACRNPSAIRQGGVNLLWRLVKTLAFWVLLVWGIATGIVMFGIWVAAKHGYMPQFGFFRAWGILYLLSVIAPVAITLAHFNWWGESRVVLREDNEGEPEDAVAAESANAQKQEVT